MKRFRTLYLHIGLGKTGTTSVQADLLSRAAQLEQQFDLHYPTQFPHEEDFRGNHSRLLRTLFSDSAKVRRRLAARGLVTDDQIAAYNSRTRDCIERSFANTTASRLLLSAETVGHFTADDMHKLAEQLRAWADQIKVVACLRHPAHALSSEIQQRLNIGETLESLYDKPPAYGFRSLFKRVEQAFGQQAVIVYDFAVARENPLGLTWVLFDQLGIDVGDLFEVQPAANPSMSHEAALLLSALNKRRPVIVDGGPNPLRKDNTMQRLMELPGRKFAAPAAVYRKVEERVQQDLQWLQQHYQLQLQAEYLDPGLEHNQFSEQSIEALALQMSDLVRFRSRVIAPWVILTRWPRKLWRKYF